MPQTQPDHDPTNPPSEHEHPRLLSQSDPPPDAPASHRSQILLIIIVVLLVTGIVILHLTGVLGPGSH